MSNEAEAVAPEYCVNVLLPLALDRAYTYLVPPHLAVQPGLVPPHLAVQPGSYVQVPLGPQERIGVVWSEPFSTSEVEKPDRLREISKVYEAPPLKDVNPRLH